jgi:uncharacterized protein (UPF0332 family)
LSLHDDLLKQAKYLANREPKHPRQASLRRALSTAYYALFHAIISEALMISAPALPNGLRPLVGRTFDHGAMKKVCAGFGQASPAATTAALITRPMQPELISVARAFVDLQNARHQADYDTLATFSKVDVMLKIREAEQSVGRMASIRGEPNFNVFLSALLHQEAWRKRLS